ncbi:hypothetical protein M406DRAFT_341564 [Cryphonectria parasitica EP155]|uniref:Uncharacterized protein n=1 Tax=Cryphonectria parasitica (strain ATCC 38755 / EP155) TaxID=660469 RepID=A0A9P4XXE9_CRYP1|nr:uncharacterized protein M406DRAFT_341564 [Cryphonectria parasitica EP155]KAF3762330.1 hypothetical protein M406DRAFT_341564 [Cryphonectria parasitica EP155]
MAAPQQQQSHLGGVGNSRLTRASISDPTSLPESTSSRGPTGAATSQARRNDESWVEIASQPSSSSLSSISDDIVTTGLRVGNQSYPPRRRRLQHHYHQSVVQQQAPQSYVVDHATARSGTSSQEEYDETESEEDRLMTSSTENMDTRPGLGLAGLQRSQTAIGPGASADLSDSEEDDDGTALGRPSPSQSFRPQPNAFSHPPAHLSQRSYSTNAAIPPPPHYLHGRPSPASHRSHNRARPDFRNPSYQADRDEALRASLTTLLSCAAAAKNLPGRRGHAANGPSSSGEPIMGAGVGPSTQPMELRLVPESELGNNETSSPLMGPAAQKVAPGSRQPTTRTSSNSSAQSQPLSVSSKQEKGKRVASTTGQPRSQRAAKKKRTSVSAVDESTVTWISPTTLTWVLGTGVVLLVSVVGFGAGFVVGREVGRQDILSSASGTGSSMSAGMNSSSCGGEVIRSTGTGTLRRWRWGTGVARSVIA